MSHALDSTSVDKWSSGLTYSNITNAKKSKFTKILNSDENSIGKSLITWQNQMTKHIKNEWTTTVIFLTWNRHFQM